MPWISFGRAWSRRSPRRRSSATKFGERLGEGGLGVVYAARDLELDRQVAIKVLRPEVTDRESPRAVARLVREARAMARLAHPNVVAVFDIREHATGTFVVMERLEGCTLGHWLNQPGRSLNQVLSVMRLAGEGLLAAHRVGLVHRDFKPANVFVCDDGQVKVLDAVTRRRAMIPTQRCPVPIRSRAPGS